MLVSIDRNTLPDNVEVMCEMHGRTNFLRMRAVCLSDYSEKDKLVCGSPSSKLHRDCLTQCIIDRATIKPAACDAT
jgi:hypothetical protein